MRRLRTLTARLVLTSTALVVVITLTIGAATILVSRSYLTSRLDQDVQASLDRVERIPVRAFPDELPVPPEGFEDRPGQAVGSLTVIWTPDQEDPVIADVLVQDSDGVTSRRALTDETLAVLADVPADGRPRAVELPGFGSYRVAVTGLPVGDRVAAGLPTDDVDALVGNLALWQAILISLGALTAAGGGVLLMRRQLRTLREVAATAHAVAALPLAEGHIDLTERVPERITAEPSEVGQVGAALNALLAHVESSLTARHLSEQRVRRFVADASHELRTPLATIAGYAELARRHPDDQATLRTALAKVDEESVRMTRLVDDLLLLARLDAGRPLERRTVDLTRLLMEAVADAQVVGPAHHWRLELPDEVIEVVGDEQRLHQVVTNLLANARKYTPTGSTVTVRARDGGFAVHDDGPGFPAVLVGRAFERFARADQARHREGGVGLGLALVEAIVGSHGGRVTLESRPGDTTVAVTLSETAH